MSPTMTPKLAELHLVHPLPTPHLLVSLCAPTLRYFGLLGVVEQGTLYVFPQWTAWCGA